MKIKSIRIKNYRCFHDEKILLNDYVCLVGANGSGKSTVLCALNVFFQEQHSASTDVQKLCDEDFFDRRVDTPLQITLTFGSLSDDAKSTLSDYVRNDELIVTAEATYDSSTALASVRHFGERRGITAFRPFFEAAKRQAKKEELDEIYAGLQTTFPGLPAATSKAAKQDALQDFEQQHVDKCDLIPSEDSFYGINSTGKLAKYVQWVYVPAVKDASQEGLESKNTAFGKLIARTVRAKTNFENEVEAIRVSAITEYQKLLETNQASLDALSASLQDRLGSWSHPDVKLGIEWLFDRNKSVQVAQPTAGIKAGDSDFLGSLSRMGHGLQRSYLLALLQELAAVDADNAPTLILGCEEPELYQHPPQARHLSDVLRKLSASNSQVLVSTHSPLFVSGDGFEDVRLVRRKLKAPGASIASLTFTDLCERIATAKNSTKPGKPDGLVAKLHQALRPHIAEMFFARLPIFVEGLEDVSYFTTWLILTNRWDDFRRLGCHFVSVNGKSNLLQPLAIAQGMGLPYYVIFDADGNEVGGKHEVTHKADNEALFRLLACVSPAFPTTDIFSADYTVWQHSLTHAVDAEAGNTHDAFVEAARITFAHEGGLKKNDLFIAERLRLAHEAGMKLECVDKVCDAILTRAAVA